MSSAERAGRQHDRDRRGRRGRARGAAQDGGRGRHGGGGQGLHHGPLSELAEHGHGPAEGEGLGHRHRAEEQSGGEVLRHVNSRSDDEEEEEEMNARKCVFDALWESADRSCVNESGLQPTKQMISAI